MHTRAFKTEAKGKFLLLTQLLTPEGCLSWSRSREMRVGGLSWPAHDSREGSHQTWLARRSIRCKQGVCYACLGTHPPHPESCSPSQYTAGGLLLPGQTPLSLNLPVSLSAAGDTASWAQATAIQSLRRQPPHLSKTCLQNIQVGSVVFRINLTRRLVDRIEPLSSSRTLAAFQAQRLYSCRRTRSQRTPSQSPSVIAGNSAGRCSNSQYAPSDARKMTR